MERIQNFLLTQSNTLELLNDMLSSQRTLSSLEIVSLCGFLGALFGILNEDSQSQVIRDETQIQMAMTLIGFFEGVIIRICEAALIEWPLTHVNDLAMLLSKAAREGSMFKYFCWSLFDPTTPKNLLTTSRLFPIETSTPTELATLAQDYPQALTAACKNYRPKNLRTFLKGVAETCRRRRGKVE